jgi:hypothetical protein
VRHKQVPEAAANVAITATAAGLTAAATPAQADIEDLEGQGIATGPIGCVFGSNGDIGCVFGSNGDIGCVFGSNGDIETCKGLIAGFAPSEGAEEARNHAAAA